MSIKTIRLITSAIGLMIALLFIAVATWLRHFSATDNLGLIITGVLTSIIVSIVDVNLYEEMKGGNDAGAMRHSSFLFSAGCGGGLLGAYLAVSHHIQTQDAIELIFKGALNGMMSAFVITLGLAIFVGIPALLLYFVFKIDAINKYVLPNETVTQIFSAFKASVCVMIFWLTLLK